jgi:hypothetical protein
MAALYREMRHWFPDLAVAAMGIRGFRWRAPEREVRTGLPERSDYLIGDSGRG